MVGNFWFLSYRPGLLVYCSLGFVHSTCYWVRPELRRHRGFLSWFVGTHDERYFNKQWRTVEEPLVTEYRPQP